LTKPIFYAYPIALQMIFDKIISSGRITIWQGRTIVNGILLNIGVTFGFEAVYRDSSFYTIPPGQEYPPYQTGTFKLDHKPQFAPDH